MEGTTCRSLGFFAFFLLAALNSFNSFAETDPPNDPLFENQWNLYNIGQNPPGGNPDVDIDTYPEAWEKMKDVHTGEQVVIGVLDSGLRWDHEEFEDRSENWVEYWVNPAEDVNGNGFFEPYPVGSGGDEDGIDNDGNGYVDDVIGWDFLGDTTLPADICTRENVPENWDNNPDDSSLWVSGHGTGTVGIVGARADNGRGLAGIASPYAGGDWSVKIMPIRICDFLFTTQTRALLALDYAIQNGAKIIQNAWAYPFEPLFPNCPPPYYRSEDLCFDSEELRQKVLEARDSGVLLVTAANNEGLSLDDNCSFLEWVQTEGINNVLAVASHGYNGGLYSSNYGSNTVHLAAPGRAIPTTHPDGGYDRFRATSAASAHVSGAAAIVRIWFQDTDPDWDGLTELERVERVRNTILRSAEYEPSLWGKVVTNGRLNLHFALCADSTDNDGDGWEDIEDNCPNQANPSQEDCDEDGIGNACDHVCSCCEMYDCWDMDGDGYRDQSCGGNDCDDANLDVHPLMTEVCNGIDDNCDGATDEGFDDLDGDGHAACEGDWDCDDSNADIHPGATEICDASDNNCVDGIDEEPAASASCDNGIFCDGEEYCDFGSCWIGADPCPDDAEFCNGTEDCDEGSDQCTATGDPCVADGNSCTHDSCSEINDTCEYPCNASGFLDPCCADPVCQNEPICQAYCADDGDCDDNLFCTGTEACMDHVCQAGVNPCLDDGQFCNGVENCDEGGDQCVSSGDPCVDDGFYCNGIESCDEAGDQCLHSGNPCDDGNYCTDDICDEVGDLCEYPCNAVGYEDPCCEEPACADDPLCEEPVCNDVDGDGFGDPADPSCPDPRPDCDDDPSDDPGGCDVCSCGTAECAGCAKCIYGGAKEFSGDDYDSNCNGNSDCFVATASFGTQMTGKLDVLREFRDGYLVTNGPGKAFVDAYYKLSPPLGEYIEERSWLKALVRTLLLPVIGMVLLIV